VFSSKSPLGATKQVSVAVMFYSCIRQILRSNLSQGTGYQTFRCFPQHVPYKFWDSISFRTRSIPSIWIQIWVHQSFYYLPLCNLVHRQGRRRNHSQANRIVISYVIPVLSTGPLPVMAIPFSLLRLTSTTLKNVCMFERVSICMQHTCHKTPI
jgi:hypothetical protein